LIFLLYFLFLPTIQVLYKNPLVANVGHVLGVATDITVEAVFQDTNQKRVENGLSPLTQNSKLSDAACRKAKYMFDNNLWAHYGRDGTTPWSFISATVYRYLYAGENLAQNFMLSGDVVNAWMASPSHRQNLLNGNYTDVGYCVSNGTLNGTETTLVVQMFGRPQGGTQPLVRNVGAETRQVAKVVPTKAQQTPTTVPKKVIIPQPKQLAAATKASSLPYTASVILFSLLFVAFAFDLYFAYSLRLVRVGGKHMAHFIFIAFILISLAIISKGAIL
jgi:uncharacterized protein YkwD